MFKISKMNRNTEAKAEKPFIRLFKYIIVIVGIFLVWNLFFMNAKIPSGSMENTIMPGDRVLCYRTVAGIGRGDIVVFVNPMGSGYLVKRVVAIPGDRVGFLNGKLLLNGVVQEEEYTLGKTEVDEPWEELTVPEGEYFLLGDNREHSIDCRKFDYPFIRGSDIKAKMWLRYYPSIGLIV